MKNYFGGVFAGDKNQNMLKISFKGHAKIRVRGHQGRPGQAQNKNRTKHGKPNTIASAGMKLT